MAKHKDVEFGNELFARLEQLTGTAVGTAMNTAVPPELRKMKKFRFQLLHRWLVAHFTPCRVADIAGGKGLLAYLLQTSGWQATVIDPHYQPLTEKYKDITTGQRIKLSLTDSVPHINKPFTSEMGEQFDLLVGMHAHGCNAEIIDAAARFGCAFVLFPCCVIGEPFVPAPGEHWLESLAAYALDRGHTVTPFRLNFKGQNIGLYGVGRE
ncbi:MAG TPA: hypothetical protein PLD25_07255 [Chloroflexota bacterium]|nr:hypothetical protein [Chloroflexota bacterium]HUM68579.1 hypothetical protein [Chloroflexota bacterium]